MLPGRLGSVPELIGAILDLIGGILDLIGSIPDLPGSGRDLIGIIRDLKLVKSAWSGTLPVDLAVLATSKLEVQNTAMLPGSIPDLKSRGPEHCQVDWLCSGAQHGSVPDLSGG